MKKIIGIAMIMAFHSALFAQAPPTGSMPTPPGTTPGTTIPGTPLPGTTTPQGTTPTPGSNPTNPMVYPNSTPGTTPGINQNNNKSNKITTNGNSSSTINSGDTAHLK
jgi:hypothetical protein